MSTSSDEKAMETAPPSTPVRAATKQDVTLDSLQVVVDAMEKSTPLSSLKAIGSALRDAPTPTRKSDASRTPSVLHVQQDWLQEETERVAPSMATHTFEGGKPVGMKLKLTQQQKDSVSVTIQSIAAGEQAESMVWALGRALEDLLQCLLPIVLIVDNGPTLFVFATRTQGLISGSRLIQIGDSDVKDLNNAELRRMLAERPVKLSFLPPATGSVPRSFNFVADQPTGLTLHWRPSARAVHVQGIKPGSAAHKMGLLVGSKLVGVNGTQVSSVGDENSLLELIAQRPATFDFLTVIKSEDDEVIEMVRSAKSFKRQATDLAIPEKRSWQDKVVMTLLLCLLPYMLAAYLGIALALLPLRVPSLLYGYLQARGDEPRSHVATSWSFYAVMSFETALLTPLVIFAVAHVVFVQIVTFLWCAPFGILSGVKPLENWKLVWQSTHYMKDAGCGLPLTPQRVFQFWRCVLGLYHRQHFWEWILAPGWMIVFNPVLKYAACCNIWIYDLEEKYCNQWTEPLPGLDEATVQDLIKRIVSHYKVEDELRVEVDQACFCGHYAAPPPDAPSTPSGMKSIGMQFAPKKLSTNLTMTTHQYRITPTPKPRSPTAKQPLWAVELHYWNAWHFLTGYVEVSMHADPDHSTQVALEHPMWIIAPRNGLLGNKLYLGVNKLFADYSPELHATITKAAAKRETKKDAAHPGSIVYSDASVQISVTD